MAHTLEERKRTIRRWIQTEKGGNIRTQDIARHSIVSWPPYKPPWLVAYSNLRHRLGNGLWSRPTKTWREHTTTFVIIQKCILTSGHFSWSRQSHLKDTPYPPIQKPNKRGLNQHPQCERRKMHFDTHSTPSNNCKCHNIGITQGRSRHKEAIPNIDIMSHMSHGFPTCEEIRRFKNKPIVKENCLDVDFLNMGTLQLKWSNFAH
jgi:hypothetical protein